MEPAAIPTQIGRFKILEKIGEGAMGTVYKATDTLIQRTVAIKTIRLDVERSSEKYAEVCQRFYHEARVSATLIHPNIVTLFDLGDHEGTPFLAMEFVEGRTLSRRMSQEPALSLREICDILEQVAAALDFAHQKGIVHRDIKPGNIMIDPVGKVKVMDYGIAKVVDSSITRTGTFVGTPSYISPEQASEGKVDYRSDLFSLAVLSYEMLIGEKPFQGSTIPNLLYKIVFENAPRPRNLGKWGITIQQWDRVFSRALAKDPEKRYQSASELVSALRLHFLQESQPFKPVVAPALTDTAKLSSSIRQDIPSAVIEHVMEETRSRMSLMKTPAPAVPQAEEGFPAPPIEDTVTSRSKALSLVLLLVVTAGLIFVLLRYVWPIGGGSTVDIPGVKYVVQVDSQPQGADIVVDGTATGLKTPETVEITGVAGEQHMLSIRKSCFNDHQTPIILGPGAPARVSPTLEATELEIEVQTNPPGATLSLDGTRLEPTSPAKIKISCAQKHQVTAALSGFQPATKDLDPAAIPNPLVINLAPKGAPGMLEVRANYDYEVFNGRSRVRAASGRETIPLDPGSYRITIVNNKYLLRVPYSVTIESNKTVPIDLPVLGWFTSILGSPDNCEICIDGTLCDYPPMRNVYVAPGEHTITVKWPDGRVKNEVRTVVAGQAVPEIFVKP